MSPAKGGKRSQAEPIDADFAGGEEVAVLDGVYKQECKWSVSPFSPISR